MLYSKNRDRFKEALTCNKEQLIQEVCYPKVQRKWERPDFCEVVDDPCVILQDVDFPQGVPEDVETPIRIVRIENEEKQSSCPPEADGPPTVVIQGQFVAFLRNPTAAERTAKQEELNELAQLRAHTALVCSYSNALVNISCPPNASEDSQPTTVTVQPGTFTIDILEPGASKKFVNDQAREFAGSQLNCAFSNSEQTFSCPPGTIQAETSTTITVEEGLFIAPTADEADALAQAYGLAQLNCAWTNDPVDCDCSGTPNSRGETLTIEPGEVLIYLREIVEEGGSYSSNRIKKQLNEQAKAICLDRIVCATDPCGNEKVVLNCPEDSLSLLPLTGTELCIEANGTISSNDSVVVEANTFFADTCEESQVLACTFAKSQLRCIPAFKLITTNRIIEIPQTPLITPKTSTIDIPIPEFSSTTEDFCLRLDKQARPISFYHNLPNPDCFKILQASLTIPKIPINLKRPEVDIDTVKTCLNVATGINVTNTTENITIPGIDLEGLSEIEIAGLTIEPTGTPAISSSGSNCVEYVKDIVITSDLSINPETNTFTYVKDASLGVNLLDSGNIPAGKHLYYKERAVPEVMRLPMKWIEIDVCEDGVRKTYRIPVLDEESPDAPVVEDGDTFSITKLIHPEDPFETYKVRCDANQNPDWVDQTTLTTENFEFAADITSNIEYDTKDIVTAVQLNGSVNVEPTTDQFCPPDTFNPESLKIPDATISLDIPPSIPEQTISFQVPSVKVTNQDVCYVSDLIQTVTDVDVQEFTEERTWNIDGRNFVRKEPCEVERVDPIPSGQTGLTTIVPTLRGCSPNVRISNSTLSDTVSTTVEKIELTGVNTLSSSIVSGIDIEEQPPETIEVLDNVKYVPIDYVPAEGENEE